MKKYISFVIIVFLIVSGIFQLKVLASEELNSFNIDVDKTIINPNKEVKLTINFGVKLATYSVTVDYDDDLLDFVSVSTGKKTDLDGKIKIENLEDSETESIIVTFKGKEVTTTNPTEFSVTAENMTTKNLEKTYNNITVAHMKNITVEPEYKDYTLDLKYDGTITAGAEKDIVISYSSEMGKNYPQARLIAEATMPEGATVSLIGTHTDGVKYDIIKTGWGDPQGYPIGGKNITQNLNFKGTFSKNGNYKITLKLIDRLNSNTIISEKTFDVIVGEVSPMPEQLPKTGVNIYSYAIFAILALTVVYVYYNKVNE